MTAKKIKDFFSKCDQILGKHLLKKSLMENFIFCAVCLNRGDLFYPAPEEYVKK